MVEKFIPYTLTEALDILSNHDCYLVGGGTDLMVAKKNTAGLLPKFDKNVMYLSHIDEQKKIYKDDDGVHIGSGATLDNISKNKDVPTLLKKCISEIASINIRHFATLAGNIANASPAGDTIVVDVLLDAKVKLVSKSGTRLVDAIDFVQGVRKIDRHKDELITELIFPTLNYENEMWWKVGSRKADSISKLSFAGYFTVKNKKITQFAVTFGSVSIKPSRSKTLENEIIGMSVLELEKEKEQIIEKYSKIISPIDDQRSNKEYRQKVAMNILAEFLNKVIEGGK